MGQQRRQLATTTSLCPTCLDRVSGTYETDGDAIYLSRSCLDHGATDRKVWTSLDHWEWASAYGPSTATDGSDDLTVDGDHACLAVVEITDRLDPYRLASLYADRESSLRDGAAALDDTVEAGRLGYVSVVADVVD